MKREIKFRAWNNSYMAYQGTPDLETLQSFIFHYGDNPLMQYTGIKDKHGKEIYEGDILGINDPCDDSKCVVIFEDAGFKRSYEPFLTDEDKEDDYHRSDFVHQLTASDLKLWKVIGNIYENPELLK